MLTYELVTEPADGVVITWEGGYYWSTPRPATRIDPPEGGLELEDDIRPIGVTYHHARADKPVTEIVTTGGLLHHLLVEKYGLPSDEDQWEAAGEANAACREDTRW